MNHLKLQSRGLFEGEFVVTTENCSFSIGEYIEVVLREPPHPTGDIALGPDGKGQRIIDFLLTIVECCHIDEIEATLRIVTGASCSHWSDCLEVGKVSVVTPYKYWCRDFIWYMPKIDGWIKGAFGKVKNE